MTIDDASRLHLYEQARSTWGAEAANTLINTMNAGPDRLATKDDLAVQRAETHTEFAALRGEMRTKFAAVRAEMRTEFAKVRAETASGFADVRGETQALRAEMTDRILEMTRTLMFGVVASNATLVGLVFAAVKLA